jgi:hypothetical protein
MKNDDDI